MSDNKSLVAMIHDFSETDRKVMEAGGELTPELEQEFSLTSDNVRSKVDRYKMYMDHLDSKAEYMRDMERQFAAARKSLESQRERLKGNLKFAMSSMQVTELVGHDFRFKLSALKPTLQVNEDELPEEYKLDTRVLVPDKERILLDLELGRDIPGASLKRSESIRSYTTAVGKTKPVKEKS